MEQNEVKATNPVGGTQQTIIINQTKKKSNGLGTVGFVLALIALFFLWVPYLAYLAWNGIFEFYSICLGLCGLGLCVLGLIFSFIGIFKKPRGLAIAGLVISLIVFIIRIIGLVQAILVDLLLL